MNAATGEKRIDAIMAVLNKLVEQRKEMHAEMNLTPPVGEASQGARGTGLGRPMLSMSPNDLME
jgi:hypothetical protein